MNPSVEQRIAEVSATLRPLHGTAHWGPLATYIKSKTNGKTLADYLNSDATDEAKMTILNDVDGIVKSEQWHLLPAPPAGQAQQSGGNAPSPVPAAAPAKAKPTPVPATAVIPTPAPAKGAIDPKQHEVATQPAPVVSADPMAMMAQALAPHLKLLLPQPAPTGAPVNPDALRAIVREELAVLFGAFVKGVTTTSKE